MLFIPLRSVISRAKNLINLRLSRHSPHSPRVLTALRMRE